MDKEYPLFPELNEVGNEEAQKLIDKFKKKLSEAAEEVLMDFYCDVAVYIQSDSWQNFRNEIMDGMKNYNNRKIQAEYDFSQIRKAIYKEFKDELIPELNQDLLKENDSLKQQIAFMEKARRNIY